MRRWEILVRSSAWRRGAVLEIRCRSGPGVREELAVLVAAEARHCPFLSWTLDHDHGQPVVRIEADADRPDDIAAIAAIVGARAV